MYYPHFGLKEAPFKITPNTDFFFKGGNRGSILEAITYAIKSGEGIIKVVGEVGSGKTMICRMLQKTLPEEIESIYLAIPSVEPEHVLHAIAFELQLKLPRNADRLKVMQLLQNYLLKRHAKGEQTVIFVEEAQAMPIATLEEIRLLSNLETNQDKLLQIVLFGQPELDINLNELDIRQLRDRITHSFTLGPLEAKDIGEYLIFRLRAAGYFGPHLFSDKAIKKIAIASDGLIRRVNILADKSLLSAFSENVFQVTPKHVKAAIQDSEFGHKPTNFKLYFLIASVLSIALLGALIMVMMRLNPAASIGTEISKPNTPPTVKEKSVSAFTNTKKDSINTVASDTTNIELKQPTSLDERITWSRNILINLPDETFTIQIMTAINDEDLSRELSSFEDDLDMDQVYIYQTTNKNTSLTMILYGHYPDQQAASIALKTLPNKLKQKKPYLRTIGKIKPLLVP